MDGIQRGVERELGGRFVTYFFEFVGERWPWLTNDPALLAMIAGVILGGLVVGIVYWLVNKGRINELKARVSGLEREISILERQKNDLERQKADLENRVKDLPGPKRKESSSSPRNYVHIPPDQKPGVYFPGLAGPSVVVLPYRPPPQTTDQVLSLLERLNTVPRRVPIKIVATHACMAYAKDLARIFSAAHYEIISNSDTHEQIYIARTERRGIVVRYRKVEDSFFNASCEIIASLLEQLASATTDPFPPGKNINHLQIEIGGKP